MDVTFFLCSLIVLAIIASWFYRGADVLSPSRVFLLIWALSIGLAELKLSLYQHDWTWYGWIVVLLGVVSFLVGLLIPTVGYFRTPLLHMGEVRNRIQKSVNASLDANRFFWITMMLFSAYLVAFAAEATMMGNVPLLAANPERARVTFGVFGLHLFVTSMLSILIFCLEYLLFMRGNLGRRIAILLVFVATAGTFFLLLQRYSFVFWALLALGITYYGSRKLRWRTVLVAVGLFLGFLFMIQSIRTAIYVEQYVYVISKMKYGREFAAFTEPYMYIVMNLENVARGAERLDHYFMGYFTFDWVLALSGLKHWLGDYLGIERLPFLNSDYNTYAFQWTCYYDYGVVGVALIPLFLGLFAGFSYYRLRTQPSILLLYAYSIALVFMLTSFREFLFSRLDAVSNFALIWVVHRYFAIKRAAHQPL
jgi:oligosaccharide repeat unit polymerase